jgi:hypothetical protein
MINFYDWILMMNEPKIEQIYLSRHNLETLISKLDRKKNGESTKCTLIKKDNIHPVYPQSMPFIAVTAVEDDEYYKDRIAGIIHPNDRKE